MTEESLQFGEGGRLSAILTLASTSTQDSQQLPVFVILNSGMLHRVGPYRLSVQVARGLSRSGFCSLRVDLAGKGNSAPRPGLKYQDSVATDFEEILRLVETRFGRVPLVLVGLCSGADDAIRMTPGDARIIGLVLLDPVCARDNGFALRDFLLKYGTIARYFIWMKRRLGRLTMTGHRHEETLDPLSIRNSATQTQLRSALGAIGERRGRVLAIFTRYSLSYYNQVGQLGKVSGVNGCQQFCTEVFWPRAEHTYPLELHRRQLIDVIRSWVERFNPSELQVTD